MDNNYAEFKEEKLENVMSREELLLEHTHSFIVEYSFSKNTFEIFPKQNHYVNFDWRQLRTERESEFLKTVFKPDVELYKHFIDLSNVTTSIKRSINIRLYVVPHIYEWFRIILLCYVNEIGEKEKTVMLFTNAEKEIEAVHELKSLVKVDLLTQLPNIDTFSMQTWELLKNHPNQQYAIVRMDMQKFRLLNQFYGTKEGDNVLRFVGVKLQECMDSEELYTYCHLSSDIFAVCMTNDMNSINRVIRYIQDSMDQYPLDFEMNMSFGIYMITEQDKTDRIPIVSLVDRAAIAQRVKNNYINKIAVFDESIAAKEYAEQNVIMEMNNALGTNQFHIYLQPKTNAVTGKIVGSEALVRWIHPTKGVISPADFVPIFESNGFISEVDYYVLDKTCATIRRWLDNGIPAKPVSVNLSRANLYSPRILNDIMECVQKYDVPHNLIEFEITESAFAVDNVHLNNLMTELQKNNFRILMDDFGSGYSSLNSLRELMIDILKIDIKFLPGNKDDKRAEIILSSVISMAESLGLDVVMEGVETHEQIELLQQIGCKIIQGYVHYKPMPVEDYERIVCEQADLTYDGSKINE